MKTPVLAALAATLILAPFAARAADNEQARIVIKTSDLNLATPAGHAALVRRIRRAAGELCGPPTGTLDLLETQVRFKACVAKASAAALAAAPTRPLPPRMVGD